MGPNESGTCCRSQLTSERARARAGAGAGAGCGRRLADVTDRARLLGGSLAGDVGWQSDCA